MDMDHGLMCPIDSHIPFQEHKLTFFLARKMIRHQNHWWLINGRWGEEDDDDDDDVRYRLPTDAEKY